MTSYSVQEEAKRILRERLLNDNKLCISPAIVEAAQNVNIVGVDSRPFIPTPCKMTESSSALSALVAAAASAVSADRYGIGYQDIEVDTDLATLFLESLLLPNINGKSIFENGHLMAQFKKSDIYDLAKPIHRLATNVYKTKDGKFYHLHGSMNADPTMKMVGVEEQDATEDEALKIYADKVAQHDAAFLEKTANEEFRQAGVTCFTPEEFFASEHGKVIAEEPLWSARDVPASRSSWPAPQSDKLKPLEGIRVIDFSRVIAAPVISKMLAVLGAEVIKVSNENLPDVAASWVDLSAGKKDTNIDLKSDEGKLVFAKLVEGADVLINGYRPGVLDKLGFNSEKLRSLNERLIYVRENCYGFTGPLAYRSGWQQISDCLVGISWLQGRFLGLDEPVVPLLPAILQALLERTKGDTTFDIDVSLTQYNIWYYRLGQYNNEQCNELLARNPGFEVRHTDDMRILVGKTHAAMLKARPELLQKPEYFWKMSGSEWGLQDDISILAPAFTFSKSKLEYAIPSGSRGRSLPEWTN